MPQWAKAALIGCLIVAAAAVLIPLGLVLVWYLVYGSKAAGL